MHHESRQGKPKVVAIGGGTGLSVMLRGLKERPLDLTAIVTVADDGGSSGILRTELQIPPPGDIRNVLTALADVEPMLSRLLEYRFTSGNGLAGHSMGNLILAAMKDITGDFVTGVQELSKVLAVRGRVLPAAHEAIVLKAEMEDGSVVVGESRIPKAEGRIRRVRIEPPDASPLPEAIAAIERADAIIIGPGSLYTSIMPNLLVPDIARALRSSNALILFVCNIMTQPGETDGYNVSDHLRAIAEHLGEQIFDAVIVHDGEIPADVLERYAEQGAGVVEVDRDAIEAMGCRVLSDKLVKYGRYLRHDTEKLSERIYRLIMQWKAESR
jgi:uncharacterized cofD-like protein